MPNPCQPPREVSERSRVTKTVMLSQLAMNLSGLAGVGVGAVVSAPIAMLLYWRGKLPDDVLIAIVLNAVAAGYVAGAVLVGMFGWSRKQ